MGKQQYASIPDQGAGSGSDACNQGSASRAKPTTSALGHFSKIFIFIVVVFVCVLAVPSLTGGSGSGSGSGGSGSLLRDAAPAPVPAPAQPLPEALQEQTAPPPPLRPDAEAVEGAEGAESPVRVVESSMAGHRFAVVTPELLRAGGMGVSQVAFGNSYTGAGDGAGASAASVGSVRVDAAVRHQVGSRQATGNIQMRIQLVINDILNMMRYRIIQNIGT
jgi:hypothetical protein